MGDFLLTYFFRHTDENIPFNKFSFSHFSLIIFLSLLIFIIYKNRKIIADTYRIKMGFRYILALIIIMEQVIYYIFFLGETNSTSDLLPVYTCRVALIFGFLGLLTDSSKLKTINVYWGSIGGILPILSPDILPYKFPHATVVCFFMAHYAIILCAAYFIFVENYDFSKKDLNFMYIFANFNLLVYIGYNFLDDANAGYLRYSPILTDFFAKWPIFLYVFLVLAIYNILIFIVYLLGSKWTGALKAKE